MLQTSSCAFDFVTFETMGALMVRALDVAQGLACSAESLTHASKVPRLGRGWRGVQAGQRGNVLIRSSLERASPNIVMHNMP